jgi:hypothetical protein
MNVPISFRPYISHNDFLRENKNVEEFLKKYNGRATKYTVSMHELYSAMISIENKLKSIHLNSEGDRKGVYFIYYSGNKLPNNYGYSKIVNRIQFDFDGKNWIVSNIEKIKRGPTFMGGIKEIFLQPKNREIANRNFFKNLDKVIGNLQ